MRRTVLVVALGASLAGCAGTGDSDPSEAPVTVEVTVTESAPAAPTVTATTTATVEATVTETVTSSPSGAQPSPVSPVEHGGEYWAVYAAVGTLGSDELAAAQDRLAEMGYEAGSADLNCDQGAREALGTDAEGGVAVYFESAAEAFDLAAQMDPPPVGVARITAFCAD